MKIPTFAKFVLKMIAMAGVNEVLGNVVKSTTPLDISITRQVMINIGKLVISEAVAGFVADRVVSDIEEALSIPIPVVKIEKEPTSTEFPVGSEKTPSSSVGPFGGMTINELTGITDQIKFQDQSFQKEVDDGGTKS